MFSLDSHIHMHILTCSLPYLHAYPNNASVTLQTLLLIDSYDLRQFIP